MNIIVAISYNEGVIMCEQYERLNGDLIERQFSDLFAKSKKQNSKLWVQDGEPSQNSAVARIALSKIGAELLSIPPGSPDINTIENIFHHVKKKLQHDALVNNTTKENLEQFSSRVKRTLQNVDKHLIDKTIDSMDKRLSLIIKSGGDRTKY